MFTVRAKYVQAGVRFHGTVSKPFQVIYTAFVDFMGVTGDVHLHARKSMGRYIGYVNSADLDRGIANVYFVDGYLPVALSSIGHELTHVIQYKTGDLGFDGDTILWKRRPAISGTDYAKLNQAEHAQLPWEREAVANGKVQAKAFLAGIESLRGRDAQLDVLIDSGLLA